jgi:hypothetical protein
MSFIGALIFFTGDVKRFCRVLPVCSATSTVPAFPCVRDGVGFGCREEGKRKLVTGNGRGGGFTGIVNTM